MNRVGHSRRRWTSARSRRQTRSARSGLASKLAATTASSTAYLMPAPAAGVMVWAASPISSRPRLYQRRQRLDATDKSEICCQSVN